MRPIELTRKALYDLVWAKPMTKVAQEFGISDVALKKICARHRVPTPSRGYWAKKAVRKPVKQIRFVGTADPQDERIVIYGSNQKRLPASVKAIIEQDRAARADRPKSLVPKLTQGPRPLDQIHEPVLSTAKTLRAAKPDKNHVVSAIGTGLCGIEIGFTSVERVIGIIDDLAHSLESRGVTLSANDHSMSVSSNGETIAFKLVEKVLREQHVPTVDELAQEEKRRKRSGWGDWSYQRAYPEWDFIRTGELMFEIENQYLDGFRRTWKDGKRQRLEDLIDDFSIGIIAYAAGAKIKREERERSHRNWERQSRVYARAEKRRVREEERSKILDELVAISNEAGKLRMWLSEAEKWPQPKQPNEFTRFVEWAKERLDFLEHQVDPGGISEMLESQELFPETDPLIDPPEDLIEE